MSVEVDKRSPVMASRKLVLVVAVAAVIAIVFVSGVAAGTFMASPSSKGTNEALSVEGVATIKVLEPDGQVVGVWTAHNTLVQSGKDLIAICLGIGAICPTMSPTPPTCSNKESTYCAVTQIITVGLSSCTISWGEDCGVQNYTTTEVTPSGCLNFLPTDCTGWIASTTFTSAGLGCASTCALVDVASGNGGALQFDDISGAALPSITISAGQSLAISIQFTVS